MRQRSALGGERGLARGQPCAPTSPALPTHPLAAHALRPPHAHSHTRRADAGLPVVRGVNYAGVRFLKEAGRLSEAEALELEEGAVTETKMPPLASRAALQ